MNKVLSDKIQNRLKELELKFDATNDFIHVGMNIDNVIGKVSVFIQTLDNTILSYAVLNNKAPAEHINGVSEFLHRANYGLVYGNFEIDFEDGEIRYKLVTDCQEIGNLPNSYIDRSVLLPCQMIQKYGNGIILLMLGVGVPQDLIEEIEKSMD